MVYIDEDYQLFFFVRTFSVPPKPKIYQNLCALRINRLGLTQYSPVTPDGENLDNLVY